MDRDWTKEDNLNDFEKGRDSTFQSVLSKLLSKIVLHPGRKPAGQFLIDHTNVEDRETLKKSKSESFEKRRHWKTK